MKTHLIKWILLGYFLAIFQLNNNFACSCPFYIENFCGIVNEGHVIVRAIVLDSAENDRDADRLIKVLDNLNQVIHNDTATLYGADGLNCGERLDLFSPGDTLIMALDPYYYLGVYYLEGSCGVHYLRYSEGRVFDSIYPSTDTMDYQVFVDELLQCMDFSTSVMEPEESSPPVRFYPNPFTHEITIESSVEIGESSVVSIFSIAGQLLRQETFGVGTTKTLSMEICHKGFTW